MSIVATSIREVSNSYKIYIYLLKDYELTGVARDLIDNIYDYGIRLGDIAVVILAADHKRFDKSLYDTLENDSWFKDVIGDPHKLPAGYIITMPNLESFSASKGSSFIYVSGEVINLAYKSRIELSQDIVDFCKHKDKKFLSNILEYSRSSIFNPGQDTSTILENLRDAVILEPNFNGVGFRIKPLTYAINNIFKITKDEPPVYDCIIYQF